jgi:hypothetical protein
MTLQRLGLRALFAVLAGLLVTGTASAEDVTQVALKPILTVTGDISPPDGGNVVEFDRQQLEALGTEVIRTSTPWYETPVEFEGVPLAKLMDYVGASGTVISAVALNDYSSEIPIEDFAKYDVILAMKRDGEYMPVTDKGPLFIVYPYDSSPELKSETFYSRSVWQVAKIVVH